MPLWKNTDAAANSVIWAAAQYKTTANTTTQTAFFGNNTPDAFMTDISVGQFGADANETALQSAITHAGWVVRKEGTGGRAGRVQYETLVAMGSMTGDAEDSILVDVVIGWAEQPESVTVAAPAATAFDVVTATTPDGVAVTYQWQANTGAGFANLTNAGVYSGVTTDTLSIADSTGLTGNQYRVLASAVGGDTITSDAAVLTVTA